MQRNSRARYHSIADDIYEDHRLFVPTVGNYHASRNRFYSVPHYAESNTFDLALQRSYANRQFMLSPDPTIIEMLNQAGESSHSRKRRSGGRTDSSKQRFHEPGNKRRRGESAIVSLSKEPTAKEIKYAKLSQEIEELSMSCQQSHELLQKKLNLRAALLAVFRKLFPDSSLFLVGSSCNGFATDSSDADFCLMLTQNRAVDQKYEAVVYLRTLQKLLKSCNYIKKLQMIRAKVPILKFNDTVSGCECDVNINNSVGIRNTHLLRAYSRIDKRVRPLLMVVKRWAKLRGINDASQGTLSSYSIALMVIHYLQCGCKPAVIPSLQQDYPDYFSEALELDRLPLFDPADHIPCNRSENRQSLGELLAGFFEYFGIHFRWDFLAVSVRLGRATPKGQKDAWRDKFICIEEPFNQTNTARAVYHQAKFKRITEEFSLAHSLLDKEQSLPILLKECNDA